MVIYHGSKEKIVSPKEKGSASNNDYGPAFYATLDLDAAKLWACKNDSIGIVNEYYVDNSKFKKLRILDLTKKNEYSVLNWIAILMHYRKLDSNFVRKNSLALAWLERYYINIDDYDAVIGFRADDSYFRFPIRFVSNDLAIEDLENTFLLGDLGVQYAFISNKSLQTIHFKRIIECDNSYIGKYYQNVISATEEFNQLIDKPKSPEKRYILDLMRTK